LKTYELGAAINVEIALTDQTDAVFIFKIIGLTYNAVKLNCNFFRQPKIIMPRMGAELSVALLSTYILLFSAN
jgi:hypothetical protein